MKNTVSTNNNDSCDQQENSAYKQKKVLWQMPLPKSFELQWQREVIERWLDTPSIPLDARAGLLTMLEVVKEDMARLEAATSYFDERTKGKAS